MSYRLLLFLLIAAAGFAQEKPLLLQKPTMSKTHIVFQFADDLWIVERSGGDARPLTVAEGVETHPYFSPDGSQIAFTGEYDGNIDVFVVPATGGVPRRLTWHPGPDEAAGWTPDGKSVVFRSGRTSYNRYRKLFTISATGGNPTEIPLAMASLGSYSPDASQMAYMPLGFFRPQHSYDAWKQYRGGRSTKIWIANLSDSSVTPIPRKDSNDSFPIWMGDSVYFLSDRGGPVTLYSYDVKSKKVAEVIKNDGLDLRWASAGPDAIVFEQFGEIKIFDPKSKKVQPVSIRVTGDLLSVRPHYEKATSQNIRAASISPTGVRAVFEVRGEILSVPAEKGDPRNMTASTGAHDRDPAWSPDGQNIAWFSDESGEYKLHVRKQDALSETKTYSIGDKPGFFRMHSWSPDSKKILYADNRLNVWYLDVEAGTNKKIDTDYYYDPLPLQFMDPSWSPDSKWVTYTKQLRSHLRAVFAYSVQSGETRQLTDGMSDARNAVFDQNGKYLYFTASTDVALTPGWLDMSSSDKPVTRNVYVMVLRNDEPSPLAPESDEEKVAGADGKKPENGPASNGEKSASGDEKAAAKDEKPGSKKIPDVRIDFENIQQRILALPIPAKNYELLRAGKSGVLFFVENALVADRSSGNERVLRKFDMKTKKVEEFARGVGIVDVSANGEKILYRQGPRFHIAPTATVPKPGQDALKLDAVEVYVEPLAEWAQMYKEVWRVERDFFYDEKLHGVDWRAQSERYEKYVRGIASRTDLNYLFEEMLGSITVGHLYIRGGDVSKGKPVRGGLLGADFAVENNRYRFTRVYDGENWNPAMQAPLTQPGVNVKAGEYLLSVNGRDVTPAQEVYSYFESTSGKRTVLKVGPDPSGSNSRTVTVLPIDNEASLRYLAWIEDNRRKVEQMTNGRVAYVHLPDTASGGFTNFNRYYFAQVGKQAAIIDERFNGGGQAADYIIDHLDRPLLNYWRTRYGNDFTTPAGAIFGPKVMIVNEFAGSGGDAMPWYFRKRQIGPLIGTRTWGGLVGILGFPPLMDGGTVTAPNVAFYTAEGNWEVENHGVAPDIEVDMDPKLVRQGRDPQLEKAVEVVMERLKKSPIPEPKQPVYPDYTSQPKATAAGSR